MFPWKDILQFILTNTLTVYFEPMFWLIIALIGYQYWQMQKNQRRMFGVYGCSLSRQLVLAVFFGTVGGIIGSFLLTAVGITLNKLGLNYIWPVALLLMVINMRFLCFAYAGGLVALSKVLFGWPEVNVPQVLALVAVLHITESVLIAISGRYSAMPMILRHSSGRLVGAFSLQNFWPLPLVLLALKIASGGELSGDTVNMPDWWPLLRLDTGALDESQLQYVMFPVVAALGYTDIAITSSPEARRRQSAIHLAAYSILLLLLALLSNTYTWLQAVAALVSPLGHELLIQLDNRREMRGKPRYVPPEHGAMILETVPGSLARRLGLKPGDILTALAGMPVNNGNDLAMALSYVPAEFTVDIRREGREVRLNASFLGGVRQMGVILVPEGQELHYVEVRTERFGILGWIKEKIKGSK